MVQKTYAILLNVTVGVEEDLQQERTEYLVGIEDWRHAVLDNENKIDLTGVPGPETPNSRWHTMHVNALGNAIKSAGVDMFKSDSG